MSVCSLQRGGGGRGFCCVLMFAASVCLSVKKGGGLSVWSSVGCAQQYHQAGGECFRQGWLLRVWVLTAALCGDVVGRTAGDSPSLTIHTSTMLLLLLPVALMQHRLLTATVFIALQHTHTHTHTHTHISTYEHPVVECNATSSSDCCVLLMFAWLSWGGQREGSCGAVVNINVQLAAGVVL